MMTTMMMMQYLFSLSESFFAEDLTLVGSSSLVFFSSLSKSFFAADLPLVGSSSLVFFSSLSEYFLQQICHCLVPLHLFCFLLFHNISLQEICQEEACHLYFSSLLFKHSQLFPQQLHLKMRMKVKGFWRKKVYFHLKFFPTSQQTRHKNVRAIKEPIKSNICRFWFRYSATWIWEPTGRQ